MRTDPSLDAAWRDLNRRSTILWLLFFGCIPGMFLLAYLLNDLLLQEAPFFVVAIAWMGIAKLAVSPLQQAILRELVLLQAAQAKLRPLQPDEVGERDVAAGRDRTLATTALTANVETLP